MRARSVVVGVAVLGALAGALGLFAWSQRRDATLRWLVNSPLARFATRADRADPEETRARIAVHANPAPARDDFEGELGAAWEFVNLNGRGIVTRPPEVHAADARVEGGQLVLRVLHDSEFASESPTWREGQAAAERYNNAYAVGFQGYSPTPGERIDVESRFSISPGFHGSTGIWVEEAGTFDPESGRMEKPFRAFGFSYLGPRSRTFLAGPQFEAVVGFVPVCARPLGGDLDVTRENVYRLVWSVVDEGTMRAELFVNDRPRARCEFPSFHPGEIQLWADNYRITDLAMGHLNLPEGAVDEVRYEYVSVDVIPE